MGGLKVASHTGGVTLALLLFALCYRNRDKSRQLCPLDTKESFKLHVYGSIVRRIFLFQVKSADIIYFLFL